MKKTAAPLAVDKLRTGIRGFDEITTGGLPRGRTTLVVGGPGCGKTVFALQTLVNGAREDKEAGLFVAFEESTGQLLQNASSFGWGLRALVDKQLFLFDARVAPEVVQAGDFDLIGLLALLEAKARTMGATRVVFDGLDVLLGLFTDPLAERREVYRIRDWLARTGLTGLITLKAGSLEVDERLGFLQFMVDCVLVLRHRLVDGSAFRNLRVVKYRGSGCSGDEFPITLAAKGLQLTPRGPTELTYPVTDQRVSSGLPRLDSMLRGGYHLGSNVLISGAPGTAKTTLCGLFAAAACARGERALYVSFDEGADQIVRNLRSVGIKLTPHLESGLLKIYSTRARGPNVADQFAELREQVRLQRPRILVLDPLSLLSKQVEVPAAGSAQQFLDQLKRDAITVVNTSVMEGISTDDAQTAGISTIADTWIHLAYVVQDGERNRALTIVESRGSGHSHQVRELTLSDGGVDINDVVVAQGKVLMGVARRVWEQAELATRARTKATTAHKLLQLRLAQAEAVARAQVVQTEMEARSAEIAALAVAAEEASELLLTDSEALHQMRNADEGVRAASQHPGHGRSGADRGRPRKRRAVAP
jgi:circadian clock protein KaiC